MTQAPLSYEGPLRDYPSVDTWTCVRAYTLAGEPVPAPNGTGHGWDGSMVVVCSNCSDLRGLAASPDGAALYVSSTGEGLVKKFDSATWALLASWALPGGALPGKLAVEPATGNLWVAQFMNTTGLVWPFPGAFAANASVWRYSPSGALLADVVTDVAVPADVAVHGPTASLLVADNGPSQQVAVYAIPSSIRLAAATAAAPMTRVASFGEAGGILAGASPGLSRAGAFYGLTGVAALDGGDIIVSCIGYATNSWGSGLDLRRLTPSPSLAEVAAAARRGGEAAAPSSLALVFQDLGQQWVDSAAAAPADGSPAMTFYTQHERYSVVVDGAAEGAGWTFVSSTVDALRYGTSDIRLHGDSFDSVSVDVIQAGPKGELVVMTSS